MKRVLLTAAAAIGMTGTADAATISMKAKTQLSSTDARSHASYQALFGSSYNFTINLNFTSFEPISTYIREDYFEGVKYTESYSAYSLSSIDLISDNGFHLNPVASLLQISNYLTSSLIIDDDSGETSYLNKKESVIDIGSGMGPGNPIYLDESFDVPGLGPTFMLIYDLQLVFDYQSQKNTDSIDDDMGLKDTSLSAFNNLSIFPDDVWTRFSVIADTTYDPDGNLVDHAMGYRVIFTEFYDITFIETGDGNPTPVPIPASAVLILSGIGAIALNNRRKSRLH